MNATAKNKKTSGLGKGLSALFDDNPQASYAETGFLPDVNIDDITPNPSQPRKNVSPDELIGLADSIREHGIIEPLIVTSGRGSGSSRYTLIAGERRWRAALLAQMETVPVIVKEASPQQILEMAVIENIQRQDLNAIEEAHAISELHNQHNVKISDIAKRIGRDKSTISNKLRLLKLPKQIQQGILDGVISESHAYQILTLNSTDAQLAAFTIISKKGLSVRQAEEVVKKIDRSNQGKLRPNSKPGGIIDEFSAQVEHELRQKLGKGVKLVRKSKGGRLTVPFHDDSQLEKLYEFLNSENYG